MVPAAQEIQNINLAWLGLASGERLLDLGCATGAKSRKLARLGFHCFGVEPEANLVHTFNRLAAEELPADAVCLAVQGSATAIPLDRRAVHAVLLTEVLEHIEDTAAVLAEIGRVLEPGHILVVSVPTAATERLWGKLHPQLFRNSGHVHVFERARLEALLVEHGFRVEHVVGRNAEWTFFWLLHGLLRTPSDFTGAPLANEWVTSGFWLLIRVLRRLPLASTIKRVSNRLFPKSMYIYARYEG
jgi:SAM-dependent methyltransferase